MITRSVNQGFEQAYRLFDIPLSVQVEAPIGASLLESILGELRAEPSRQFPDPVVEITVRARDTAGLPPVAGRIVYQGDGLTIRESENETLVTDDDSWMRVEPAARRCDVVLGASFETKPSLVQRNFWAFALAKLLRSVGLFTLHAAGLVSPDGTPILIIARSGSGKSTLAVGLLRAGWRILSDDALVMRETCGGVEALGLRKHLYIDGADAERYRDFSLSPAQADRAGGARFRLAPGSARFEQVISAVKPEVLLFPRIADTPSSTLSRVSRADAMGRLLEASGPQTLDRSGMEPHLRALSRLTQQAVAIDLKSGRDLHSHPEGLEQLLAERGLLRKVTDPELAAS